jgi:hypothetical protein
MHSERGGYSGFALRSFKVLNFVTKEKAQLGIEVRGCTTGLLAFASQDMPVVAFTAGSFGDAIATIGLVVKIIQALRESGDSSAQCLALGLELQSFHKTLIITDFSLSSLRSTPLGQVLANIIRPELDQCQVTLQSALDKIDVIKQTLGSTTIKHLWRKVMWTMSDEAMSLRAKLSTHRGMLTMLLMAYTRKVYLYLSESYNTKALFCEA